MCWGVGVGWGVLTGLLVLVSFRNKCERATGPKPEPFQSIFPGVNATRTSGTGLERDRNGTGTRTGTGVNRALGWLTCFILWRSCDISSLQQLCFAPLCCLCPVSIIPYLPGLVTFSYLSIRCSFLLPVNKLQRFPPYSPMCPSS